MGMGKLDDELRSRLDALEKQGLRRHLRRISSSQPHSMVEGRLVHNFSSNDYLGLATHPALMQAAERALKDFGTGSGASRLICGSLQPHAVLEEAIAKFKCAERALVFATGYATAVGTISALVSTGDIVIIDKLAHASIVDGARLSGAKLRVFAHNDLNDLESILQWADRRRGEAKDARILVVTESLFSMDGDMAPLGEIVELKDRFGAWLMVDEAHATGLFGANRRGLVEEHKISERVDVQMGTLGKALGSAGGYIAGSALLIEYLVNRARSFIYSTAPPPSVSAASTAAVTIVASATGAQLLKRLRENLTEFHAQSGADIVAENSPIVPKIVGSEESAMQLSRKLLDSGFFVPAVRYPTVARGAARLRITFSAAHKPEDISALSHAIRCCQE
jgi:glycine C-acetyltransferase/8-amino-7-oxononanoate synthase